MSRDSYIRNFDELQSYGQSLTSDAQRFQEAYETIKQQAQAAYDNGWDDRQQIEIMNCIDRVNNTINEIVDIINTYGNAVKVLAEQKKDASEKFIRSL